MKLSLVFFSAVFSFLVSNQALALTLAEFNERERALSADNFRCYVNEVAKSVSKPACLSFAKSFFKEGQSEAEIRIYITIGYLDREMLNINDLSRVLDRSLQDKFFYKLLSETLTGTCRGNEKLCEFDEVNPSRIGIHEFQKWMTGPDGLPKNIIFSMAYSSEYDWDSIARSSKDQALFSLRAKQHWLEGLNFGRAAIYLGHSRDGGGWDFSPPVVDEKNQTDYSYYKSEIPGLAETMLELANRENDELQLLFSDSCKSFDHFDRGLGLAAPDVTYIGAAHTGPIFGGPKTVYDVLHRLFSFDCLNKAKGMKVRFGKSKKS